MASRAPHTARAPSQRQRRAGELIRHALAEMFQRGEVHDEALRGINVTITEVKASPDLRNATVFVTALGGEGTPEMVRALGQARGAIRRVLAGKIQMKFTPELAFRADESFDEAQRIEELLRR